MRKHLTIAVALLAAPLVAQAEAINIYGWQNHSWEFLDQEGEGSFDRLSSNLAHIGFSGSADTGMNDIKVNFQCQSWTFYNQFASSPGLCSQMSKISLSHDRMGEFMFGTHLLPYTGAMIGVDPFYGVGGDSIFSIMGSVGARTLFYGPGNFELNSTGKHPLFRSENSDQAQTADQPWKLPRWIQWYQLKNGTGGIDGSSVAALVGDNPYGGLSEQAIATIATPVSGKQFSLSGLGLDTGFNKIQEGTLMYMSPSMNGVNFQFAWTAGTRDDTTASYCGEDGTGSTATRNSNCPDVNPSLYSTSLTYTNGPLWLGASYQDHEDWTAASIGQMESSDANSMRLGGRYIFDLGRANIQLSAMFESSEYEFNKIESFDEAMGVLGFGFPGSKHFLMVDYDLQNDGNGNLGSVKVGTETGEVTATEANTRLGLRRDATRDMDLKFERDAWTFAGKVKFGASPWDLRFSYMEADDLEISCTAETAATNKNPCTGDWEGTGADAFNIGMFYAMPAGTELRFTYSEINNDAKGTYGQAVGGSTNLARLGQQAWHQRRDVRSRHCALVRLIQSDCTKKAGVPRGACFFFRTSVHYVQNTLGWQTRMGEAIPRLRHSHVDQKTTHPDTSRESERLYHENSSAEP